MVSQRTLSVGAALVGVLALFTGLFQHAHLNDARETTADLGPLNSREPSVNVAGLYYPGRYKSPVKASVRLPFISDVEKFLRRCVCTLC